MKAPASAFNPRPQWARTSATTDSRTWADARSRPQAHIPYTTSASTRSGYLAAIAAASWPPCEAPNRRKRSAPTASATASAAATCPSNDRSTPIPVRQTAPGLVIADHGEPLGQLLHEAAERAQLQLPAQMADPARIEHQRRASARCRVSDAARGRAAVPDIRPHPSRLTPPASAVKKQSARAP